MRGVHDRVTTQGAPSLVWGPSRERTRVVAVALPASCMLVCVPRAAAT